MISFVSRPFLLIFFLNVACAGYNLLPAMIKKKEKNEFSELSSLYMRAGEKVVSACGSVRWRIYGSVIL